MEQFEVCLPDVLHPSQICSLDISPHSYMTGGTLLSRNGACVSSDVKAVPVHVLTFVHHL